MHKESLEEENIQRVTVVMMTMGGHGENGDLLIEEDIPIEMEDPLIKEDTLEEDHLEEDIPIEMEDPLEEEDTQEEDPLMEMEDPLMVEDPLDHLVDKDHQALKDLPDL